MPEADLLDSAAEILKERLPMPMELVTDPPDAGSAASGTLRLSGSAPWTFRVEGRSAWPADVLQSHVARAGRVPGLPLLVVSRAFTREVLERLRSAGISHVDLRGNVFLRGDGLYLWLPADRRVAGRSTSTRHPLNPFSKRSSLVLRALLEQPRRAWGIRELAAEIHVSVGHVSEVVRALGEKGYARESDGWQLGDAAAALREWAVRYDWKRNRWWSFVVPFEPGEIAPRVAEVFAGSGIRFAYTLLAGADLVARHVEHAQTHIYVDPDRVDDALNLLRAGMYAERVSGGGMLHVAAPYYGSATFYGEHAVDGLPVVSNVQLFLDLLRFPLRGAEAARALALGPLAAQLGLSRQEAATLAELAA